MADYAADISISDYIYREEITISEVGGEDRTNLSVKLLFTSSNFNFALARSDGYDVRLAENSNGTRVLNMWLVSWDNVTEEGATWFKIPNLLADEIKTLYVYWGNPTASGVSAIDDVGFLLTDHFDGTSIDTSKWDNAAGVDSISNSKLRIKADNYIEAKGLILTDVEEWIVEEGIYYAVAGTNITNPPYSSHRYRFYGTNGNFGIDYYGEGSYDRQHNVLNTDTWVTYNGTQRGLEGVVGGYSETYMGYKESNDTVYQGMAERLTYSDYDDSWERQTHGDTRMQYFRVYGRVSGASYAAIMDIDWIIVREIFETDPYSFDTSNLYVPYETVHHETIDWTPYGDDLTDVDFLHTTESGGDPYKLSDNISGNINNCWYSNDNTSYAEIIIDFGRGAETSNLVSTEYIHYDDDHTGHYNASKLSNNNDDEYFQGTTTSGYVCIDLADDNIEVGCLTIKARSDNLTGMVKDFIFLGGYKDPRFSTDSDWTVLDSGTFQQELVWQPIYFINENPYRYYKLGIIDTYGSNIVLQEWKMYKYEPLNRQMIVSHLRLNPVAFDSQEVYFPKQITLEASNNMIDWTTLLPITNTATPFYDYAWGRWQRFSFENVVGYYNYKLICYNNWNYNVGEMAIAEWEMVEKISESIYHRVLAGTSNNFSSVWASPTTTFDGGFIYIGDGGFLNIVYNNRLVDSAEVGSITDINLI